MTNVFVCIAANASHTAGNWHHFSGCYAGVLKRRTSQNVIDQSYLLSTYLKKIFSVKKMSYSQAKMQPCSSRKHTRAASWHVCAKILFQTEPISVILSPLFSQYHLASGFSFFGSNGLSYHLKRGTISQQNEPNAHTLVFVSHFLLHADAFLPLLCRHEYSTYMKSYSKHAPTLFPAHDLSSHTSTRTHTPYKNPHAQPRRKQGCGWGEVTVASWPPASYSSSAGLELVIRPWNFLVSYRSSAHTNTLCISSVYMFVCVWMTETEATRGFVNLYKACMFCLDFPLSTQKISFSNTQLVSKA